MTVHFMLELSTLHLSQETMQLLDDEEIASVAYYGESGWGWFVCTIWDDCESDIPDDLRGVLEYANSNGCEWVMFDCDGEINDNLPTYPRI